MTCSDRRSRRISASASIVADAFDRRNGPIQMGKARPNQKNTKRRTPRVIDWRRTARHINTQRPPNTIHVDSPRPTSNPQTAAGIGHGSVLAHLPFVWRRTCGIGNDIHSIVLIATARANAAGMMSAATPRSRGTITIPTSPRSAPPIAAPAVPATVKSRTPRSHSVRAFATFPRGVSAPKSACPQSPASCVHPSTIARARRPARGSTARDATRPTLSTEPTKASDASRKAFVPYWWRRVPTGRCSPTISAPRRLRGPYAPSPHPSGRRVQPTAWDGRTNVPRRSHRPRPRSAPHRRRIVG